MYFPETHEGKCITIKITFKKVSLASHRWFTLHAFEQLGTVCLPGSGRREQAPGGRGALPRGPGNVGDPDQRRTVCAGSAGRGSKERVRAAHLPERKLVSVDVMLVLLPLPLASSPPCPKHTELPMPSSYSVQSPHRNKLPGIWSSWHLFFFFSS